MLHYGLPVIYALVLWWFSTGVIIYLDGLPRRTFRWSMLGASILAVAALYGVIVTADLTTVTGAFVAFTCAVLIWGWHEMTFLMGYITGPRTAPCPAEARGWTRFRLASETVLYHEVAIAATAVLIVALTWDGGNQVAAWTYVVLWWMRLSAKLNVFLGVPNLTDEFLPDKLKYLKTYFRKKPMNALFPFSVTIPTVITGFIFSAAVTAGMPEFQTAALMLTGTMLALAVIEHWFFMLPLPDIALWRWALTSHKGVSSTPAQAGHADAAAAVPETPSKETTRMTNPQIYTPASVRFN